MMESWSSDISLGKVIPGEQPIGLFGIPTEIVGFPTITLLNARVSFAKPFVDLHFHSESRTFAHGLLDPHDLLNVVDLCAGMSCASFGFLQAGFYPRVAVELQPALATLHERIHPEVTTIIHDVTDPMVSYKIREVCPDIGTLMSGIACQPYSRGGSMGGAFDSRSATLPGVLKIAHFLQIKLLILECVEPARTNSWVQQHIRALREELGFHFNDVVLYLEDTWASSRKRWWIVATHPCLGQVPLPALPGCGSMTVRSLMPFIRQWPLQDLQQLALTKEELAAFTDGGISLRKYQVKIDEKLPTALHSWGGQAVECACGCRSGPLSAELLKNRGVYAQILPFLADGEQHWRHLHPIEVSLLTGVPTSLDWSTHQRLNLCALGQQASPLQSVWIAAHALATSRKFFKLPM